MEGSSARISGPRLAGALGAWATGSRPTSSDLRTAIRQLALDGRLAPGVRLPAERELTDALGVSRTLVTRALDRLREDGFVRSRRGAGSWLVLPSGRSGCEITGRAGWTPPVRSEVLNLSHATPAAPPELTGAMDRARPRFAELIPEHGYHPHGLAELRERLAQRYTARGLPTSADQVMITSGAQHGLAMALHLLVNPGERVLVEQPTYPNALEAIRGANATPVPVPVDDGWDLGAVEAALRQAAPALAYLIPDFHNPTGRLLDAAGRDRLATALRRTRTTAVVDETLVELNLTGGADVPPMAAFGRDRIITLGSASKAFWGGLRLGWLRAPEELVQRLVVGRPAFDLGSPVFEQLVLDELLADPEPGLRRRRADMTRQRDELMSLLDEFCPQWSFKVPDGGLSLWCDLGEPISGRLATRAEQYGVNLIPGARFSAHGRMERNLRLPYTSAPEHLREAVHRMSRAAAAVSGSTPDPLARPMA